MIKLGVKNLVVLMNAIALNAALAIFEMIVGVFVQAIINAVALVLLLGLAYWDRKDIEETVKALERKKTIRKYP